MSKKQLRRLIVFLPAAAVEQLLEIAEELKETQDGWETAGASTVARHILVKHLEKTGGKLK